MTPRTGIHLHATTPDLHGHARFRGADIAGTRGPWSSDRGGVYARGKTGRARHEVAADAGGIAGRAARHSRADADDIEDAGSAGAISRASGGRGGGRGLWHDPAKGYSR